MKEQLEGKIVKILSKGFVRQRTGNDPEKVPATYLIMNVNGEEINSGLPVLLDLEVEGENFTMATRSSGFMNGLLSYVVKITSGKREGMEYDSGLNDRYKYYEIRGFKELDDMIYGK